MNALLAALALFPASCGITTTNGIPHVTTHSSQGWHITSCVFTKPGKEQTGYAKVPINDIQPPPQPCRILPITKLQDWGTNP